jgi:hypothetical protein
MTDSALMSRPQGLIAGPDRMIEPDFGLAPLRRLAVFRRRKRAKEHLDFER